MTKNSRKHSKILENDLDLQSCFVRNGLITKLREFVQMIMKGKKKLNQVKLTKIKDRFLQLLQKQKSIKGQSKIYLKNKAIYDKFEIFINGNNSANCQIENIDSKSVIKQ